MLFYLTTLNLVKFLCEDCSTHTKVNATDKNIHLDIETCKHAYFQRRNYILNGLNIKLYTVYYLYKMAKELWEYLYKKYKTKDVGTKKFVIAKYLDFKIVDSKMIMNQVQEMQINFNDIEVEGMKLSEYFQIVNIIKKLLSLWKLFKNYLKYKRKEMTMKDLIEYWRRQPDSNVIVLVRTWKQGLT